MALLAVALLGVLASATLHRTTTPPMGWNSYNYYNCYPNEEIIKTNAKGLVDLGLSALGYQYVTTDCGWMQRDRDANGRLVWDRNLFPSGGGKELGDYLHGLGLKYALYSGAGYYQCGSEDLPASLGYEEIDAQTFAEWGGDALKYDNCYPISPDVMVDYTSPVAISPVRHQKMAAELDEVDRDFSYWVCQWGIGYDVGEWASAIGNTYRISNDIYNSWRNIWRITNQVAPFWRYTTVGAYPDMDMLIVGLRALSLEEERFHFGMWAINKTPLKIGAPTRPGLTPSASIDILRNKEVIALNQDPLGKQARLVRRYTEEEYDIWAGELSGSRRVLGIANWRNNSQTVQVNLAAVNVSQARARDVWAASDVGVLSGVQTFQLRGHELKLLVLSDIVPTGTAPRSTGYHAAADAALAGSATEVACSAANCLPAGSKVGSIGSGASVAFSGVRASSSGRKLVGVDFINYEIATDSAWAWGSNSRNMTIAVNGARSKRWAYPISGGDWSESDRMYIEVDGFVAGDNRVVFGASGSAWAPDLVGFEVLE
jgi:alpha-galactosidase